jgi:hypothetical protein
MIPNRTVLSAALALCLVLLAAGVRGADNPNLAGRWTLNRAASRIPPDVGFGMDLLGAPGASGAGEDSSEVGAAAMMAKFRESSDEAARRAFLSDEVQHPPTHLAITQTADAIFISADGRPPRAFRPDGRESAQPIESLSIVTASRWSGPRFEVRYRVGQNRELRYDYARSSDPDRLTVDIRFIERNGKDSVTLVYEPTRADEPPQPPADAARPAPQGGRAPLGAPAPPLLGQAPTAPQQAAQPPLALAPPVATGPDAALAGLKRLSVVVEELRSQAAACGITQPAIEAIASKPFTDAGMTVVKDSDEDTYLYVDIGTSTMSQGVCISRYDVFLYTNAAATLSYRQSGQALVQVQLLHLGGLVGGTPAVHADALKKNLKEAVDQFVSRIRAVNK